jgi:hypothetical protein
VSTRFCRSPAVVLAPFEERRPPGSAGRDRIIQPAVESWNGEAFAIVHGCSDSGRRVLPLQEPLEVRGELAEDVMGLPLKDALPEGGQLAPYLELALQRE